jgi:hypothetical protein
MRNVLAAVGAALLLVLAPCLASSQERKPPAPIKSFKVFLGYRYTYRAMPVSGWADFEAIMKDNADATSRLRTARTRGGIASVLGGVGGFLIGWPIGQALVSRGSADWWLAAAGGGVVLVGGLFQVSSGRQLKEGVDLYNEGIGAGEVASFDVELVVVPGGLGVRLRL